MEWMHRAKIKNFSSEMWNEWYYNKIKKGFFVLAEKSYIYKIVFVSLSWKMVFSPIKLYWSPINTFSKFLIQRFFFFFVEQMLWNVKIKFKNYEKYTVGLTREPAGGDLQFTFCERVTARTERPRQGPCCSGAHFASADKSLLPHLNNELTAHYDNNGFFSRD